MQQYLKKYFWVLGALTVVVCAIFTAASISHYLEGKFLSDKAKAPAVVVVAASAEPTKIRSKLGEPLAARNMFCSDCQPAAPETTPAVATDPNMVPYTSLSLHLVAANVSSRPEWSFATIQNTTSEALGYYAIGQEIPDAGVVKRITGKYVDFENKTTHGLERIALVPETGMHTVAAAKPVEVPAKVDDDGENKDEIASAIDSGIKQIDENSYEIDRALVDKLLANPMSVARGARIVPSVKNGKANGFKLYAIRPTSVYAKLGMSNGDTVHSVNGFDLTTPDKALEVYTKVRESTSLEVSITRRGKPVSIHYSIR